METKSVGKLNISQSCAFTGHRPRKFPWRYDENDDGCIALKKVMADQVSVLAKSGAIHYYSGMADGSDVWLAQAVLTLRDTGLSMQLHCVLPCEGQADQWS